MFIDVLTFTERGEKLANQMMTSISKCADEEVKWHLYYKDAEDIYTKSRVAFENGHALVFICAIGIAMRAIAGCMKDKLTDVPVVGMDDAGKFVVPLLSGHMGGANELALTIAQAMSATPVITTSTDCNDAFSTDLFAKEQNLSIMNREGIRSVSAKAIEGKPIRLMVEHFKAASADVVVTRDSAKYRHGTLALCPRDYAVGIGCKKGTSFEEIESAVQSVLKEHQIDESRIGAIASIDLKAEEPGLIRFSQVHKLPFLTFDAEILNGIQGHFSSSDFVKNTTGTDNVCERAAIAAAGDGASLLVQKTACDGVTVAIASPAGVKKKASVRNLVYVVGMGPGAEIQMTQQALSALEQADTIVGYSVYLELLGARFAEKEMISTPMRQEMRRCEICFEEAQKGKCVAMVCSGDAGVYGMATLLLDLQSNYPDVGVEVVPGITAATSGAAILGAPLNHDFCVISLSDLLTPRSVIEARLRAAAQGDFAIAIYNPSSHKRNDYLKWACDILLEYRKESNACGYVENIGRDGTKASVCTLVELRSRKVNMFTTVFIGNSQTKIMGNHLVTPRGYHID